MLKRKYSIMKRTFKVMSTIWPVSTKLRFDKYQRNYPSS